MAAKQQPGQLIGAGIVNLVMGVLLALLWVVAEQLWVLVLAGLVIATGVWFLLWGLSRRRADRLAALGAPAPTAPPRAVVPPARPPAPPTPVSQGGTRQAALAEAENALLDVARRTVKPAAQLTYHFVCSGNESLIRAYYDLLRVVAPVYGGTAAMYAAEKEHLDARRAEAQAAALPFDGRKHLATTVSDIGSVADALSGIGSSGFRGVFVTLVAVGTNGCRQIEEAYLTVLKDAVGQGILPFPMFVTSNAGAADFVAGSLRLVAGFPPPKTETM